MEIYISQQTVNDLAIFNTFKSSREQQVNAHLAINLLSATKKIHFSRLDSFEPLPSYNFRAKHL